MDVLDAIGNENRRKILELLAKKPCYISEISYYLKMAPKVVLEHLEKLESVGIVKSIEDGKRKYYYIARSMHLDITISPHRFEVKISSEQNLDPIEILKEIESKLNDLRSKSNSEIYSIFRTVEEICNQFSAIHGSLVSMLDELMEEMLKKFEMTTKDELERVILLAVAKGLRRTTEIAEYFKIPYREVERVLQTLSQRGIIRWERRDGDVRIVEVRV
ncbi:MAG: ArsR family transcriptional regulator [Archaeoglobaceae archaeon]